MNAEKPGTREIFPERSFWARKSFSDIFSTDKQDQNKRSFLDARCSLPNSPHVSLCKRFQERERSKYPIHVFKDCIVKPTKHCIKNGGGSKRKEGYNGADKLVQKYTAHRYAMTTRKPPHVINIC
jgi:hypothetical protein